MQKVFILFFLFYSATAAAQGITCFRDERHVDGFYESVNLEKKENGYELTRVQVNSAMSQAPNKRIQEILVTDLKCNIDELVAFCVKSEEDSSNTYVTFKVVNKSELYSLEQGEAENISFVKIDVRISGISENHRNFEFMVQDRKFEACSQL
jgi:hypothetical protein